MTAPGGSLVLRPTSGVSVDVERRRLVGGSPRRILKLSPSGIELVTGWFAGTPVGPEPAHQKLAHRLVEADLAVPSCDGRPIGTPTVDVVIPIRDDPAGLAATLAALGRNADRRPQAGSGAEESTGPDLRVVIVDDGSEPAVDPSIGEGVGVPVAVVRRSTSVGPGNARNLAIGHGRAPAIVFIDAGVIVTREQLRAMASELDVGDTVAVAPRVRSEILPGRLAHYERVWSPLDLGADGGLVGPGRRISYVPATCLAVRRTAVVEAGGFDPNLRFGEDVDLVWRLGSDGWVRYVPEIEVTHPPRPTIGRFVLQRYGYGTSAGPLAKRHGWVVAPARVDSRSAATWVALIAGFRRTAAVIAVSATAVYVAGLIRRGVSPRVAVRLVIAGWLGTTRGLAVATARTWWPLAVLAGVRSRFRLAPLLLVVGWLRRVRRPGRWRADQDGAGRVVLDTGVELALGIVDDSAYAIGVWRGAIRARAVRSLLPHVPIGGKSG